MGLLADGWRHATRASAASGQRGSAGRQTGRPYRREASNRRAGAASSVGASRLRAAADGRAGAAGRGRLVVVVVVAVAAAAAATAGRRASSASSSAPSLSTYNAHAADHIHGQRLSPPESAWPASSAPSTLLPSSPATRAAGQPSKSRGAKPQRRRWPVHDARGSRAGRPTQGHLAQQRAELIRFRFGDEKRGSASCAVRGVHSPGLRAPAASRRRRCRPNEVQSPAHWRAWHKHSPRRPSRRNSRAAR